LRGNIYQVINILIDDEVIKGQPQIILQDGGENAIQTFLKESQNCSEYKAKPNRIIFSDINLNANALFNQKNIKIKSNKELFLVNSVKNHHQQIK
jgi:hypothetical protein